MTEELEKRVYLKTIITALVIIVLSMVFRFYKFAIGIAVGTLTGILNFKLLAIRTNIITSSKRPPNPFFIIASYLFRFSIMAVVLWIAINRDILMFLGAAIGLFMTIIVIYIDTFVRKEKHVASH